MQTVTSSEIQNHFGEYLEKSRKEPIRITRSGRAAAILISPEEYEALQAMDDAYWLARAREAEKEPDLGVEESMALLKKWMTE